jgi:hypothetical protein|tara:strand:+ start:1160 stop:1954 length:795 start_codon:yes stop_codon:yes gene_type:complete
MPEITVRKATSVAIANKQFEEIKDTGWDEVEAEDLSIPFVRILQSGSPQVKKSDGAYLKGAQEGDLYNTVQNCCYSGEDGILVIPCYYSRRFIEWIPRSQEGGYVASYTKDDPIKGTAHKNDKGHDILPNGNELVNTAHFYSLLLNAETGRPEHVLITMSSTALKKARAWTTMAQSKTYLNSGGRTQIQPLMAHVYKLSTVPETNSSGTWVNWKIEHERPLDLEDENDLSMFELGVLFAKSVKADEVTPVEQPVHIEDADNSVM